MAKLERWYLSMTFKQMYETYVNRGEHWYLCHHLVEDKYIRSCNSPTITKFRSWYAPYEGMPKCGQSDLAFMECADDWITIDNDLFERRALALAFMATLEEEGDL